MSAEPGKESQTPETKQDDQNSDSSVKVEKRQLTEEEKTKPFQCNFCELRYKNKSSKVNHMKNKHQIEYKEAQQNAIAVADDEGHTEKKRKKYPDMPEAVIVWVLNNRVRMHDEWQKMGNGNGKSKSDVWKMLATKSCFT